MNLSPSKKLTHIFMLFVMLTALAGSVAFPTIVYADSTITVTTTADDTASDDECSLREAITNANDDAATHANCAAGSGDDTILFDSSLGTATIPLSGNLPTITQAADLTIDGGGDITIDGNNSAVPFTITGSSSVVTLEDLIITKGNALSGGAVYNAGDLTIDNSSLSANTATANCITCGGGAVLNEGSLTVTDSTFTNNTASAGNAGAIYNTGTLTITDSTFSLNSAVGGNGGGGIYNSGTLTVTNSIFSNNSGNSGGGGVASSGTLTVMNSTFSSNSASAGYGGAITLSSNGTITNSTFSSNSAPLAWGGGVNKTGPNTVTIRNSTFSGNSGTNGGGGGLNIMQGTVNLYNTIIANSGGGRDCVKIATGTAAGNNNLIEGSGSNACDFSNGVSGNIVGSDPNLGTLTGSPAYFPLHYGSPAVNTGDDTICAAAPVSNTSQNDIDRPVGAHCDIGSFETPTYTISGNAGVADAVLDYNDGGAQSVTSDGNGDYSLEVSYEWSGFVVPYKPEYVFTPADREYTNVTADHSGENYTATNAASVDVSIAGAPVATYSVPQNTTTRLNYPSTNSGPLQLLSTNNLPIVPSQRVLYKVNGVDTSFSEMIGVPKCDCTDTYYFAWYNNVTLDTQFRLGNVGSNSTDITITVGTTDYGPFTVAAEQTSRVSLPGVNNGPVTVHSSGAEPIVVSQRVLYNVNGVDTSYSEMMGLSSTDLMDTYFFPWYNNVTLDTQFRFGNVGSGSTDVTITVGATDYGPFTVAAGQSSRISLPGVNSGRVKVHSSSESIVVSQRVLYNVGGIDTSFSEMMGMPECACSDTYYFPWYNNVTLDTQFRLGNIDSSSTDITITVGTTDYGPFTVAAGETSRISLPGVNNGPVIVHSSGNLEIIASERVLYNVNGVDTSFSEMMGISNDEIDVEYWFPWYNNVTLDTQLRFANP